MKISGSNKNKALVPLAVLMIMVVGVQYFTDAVTSPGSKSAEIKLRAVAEGVLKETSFSFKDKYSGSHINLTADAPAEAELQIESRYNDWRYWNGLINIAMIKLGKVLNDSVYTNYALKNIAFDFDNYKFFQKRYKGEDKWSYPYGQLFTMEDLDDFGAMGASVIEVYNLDKKDVYKKYIDKAADHIMNIQHRFSDGSFIRSFPRLWTLWADDLYMSISILSRMGKLSGDTLYFDLASTQVINYNKHLFDAEKGLMYHNWYSDTDKHGVAFWGRANGWALLAQMDLLERVPESYSYRDTLLTLFKRHINGAIKYQDKDGLWHQLLDKNDSYEETSCSAMFTYAIARAVNIGILDRSYAAYAEKGWSGLSSKIQPDGKIEGVCTGTVVSDNLKDYYDRPAPLNDVHGIGVVILAGSEILNFGK